MIKNSIVKKTLEKEFKKKIGKSALSYLNNLITLRIKEILSHASRKATLSGRVVIKEEDFD